MTLRGASLVELPSNVSDLLTPHNATDPVGALGLLRDTFLQQMRTPDWQWIVCPVALVFGVAMLVRPEKSFKTIFVGLIFCVVYTITMGDLHVRYDVDHSGGGASLSNGTPIWEVVLSVEVGLCISLVAWRGFRGVELIIGMSIGVWPLREFQALLISQQIFGQSPWWNVIILTISVGIGFFLNAHDKHHFEFLLSYILPLAGGRLVSACVGMTAGYAMLGTPNLVWLDYWHSLPLGLSSRPGHYGEALSGAPGIGWSTPQDVAPAWAGEVVGCLIWILISGIAIWRHHTHVSTKQEELVKRIRSDSEAAGPPTLARKLTQPLINLA